MTNYFVESELVRNGTVQYAMSYMDGRQRKHLHTDARLAAIDFGERVSMLSYDELTETDITIDGSVTCFTARYADTDQTVIKIYLY